jgi:DNA adenine methylase
MPRLRSAIALPAVPAARPFLKWAGGKGQLLDQFEPLFPRQFAGYHEPFTGSGAVFFRLRPRRAVLSDANRELVEAFEVVRDDVDALIRLLRRHPYEERYYYRMRALDPSDLSKVERAARLLYLNRTCFNGLYRVNRSGQFNVPFGRYANPVICPEENLRAASAALEGVPVKNEPFERVVGRARRGDFVYFDPPYFPLSATSSFTAYTRDAFGPEQQERLRDVVVALSLRGCKVMLSNSYCRYILNLYRGSGFRIHKVHATRAINCRAAKRGAIPEAVITNYDV